MCDLEGRPLALTSRCLASCCGRGGWLERSIGQGKPIPVGLCRQISSDLVAVLAAAAVHRVLGAPCCAKARLWITVGSSRRCRISVGVPRRCRRRAGALRRAGGMRGDGYAAETPGFRGAWRREVAGRERCGGLRRPQQPLVIASVADHSLRLSLRLGNKPGPFGPWAALWGAGTPLAWPQSS